MKWPAIRVSGKPISVPAMLDVITRRISRAPAAASAVLSVRNLQAWYGESHVLHGIDFDVGDGQVATLLGRNGAGRSRS